MENTPLLTHTSSTTSSSTSTLLSSAASEKTLTLFFAAVCIIDVFGVFPIITLPGAVIKCGWLGLPLVIIICGVQIYTASLLGKSWMLAEDMKPQEIQQQNRYPYAALARLTLGNRTAKCVSFLLDFTVFGAGIPNIIVAAQNLQVLGLKLSQYTTNISYCYWILLLGLLQSPIMWLGSPKDMKVISMTSMITVTSTAVTIVLCIMNDKIIPSTTPPSQNDSQFSFNGNSLENLLITYGIIAFQFDIHTLLLNIQVDMKNKKDITKALTLAFLFTSILFLLTTVAAYARYGTNVGYNILENLPINTWLYVSVILVTLQLCFTSAISNTALYQDIEDQLQIPRDFNYKRCFLRTTLTVISISLAESVPRFDIIMGLIGGSLTGPIMFVLPTLFYIRISRLHKSFITEQQSNINLQKNLNLLNEYDIYNSNVPTKISTNTNLTIKTINKNNKRFFSKLSTIFSEKFDFILPRFILIFGIILTITTTYLSIQNTIKYVRFRPPCIYNVTAASDIFN